VSVKESWKLESGASRGCLAFLGAAWVVMRDIDGLEGQNKELMVREF